MQDCPYLVGKSSDVLVEQMGKPDRVEPSDYGYDWWIYQSDLQLMVGVKEGKVNQVYSADVSIPMWLHLKLGKM